MPSPRVGPLRLSCFVCKYCTFEVLMASESTVPHLCKPQHLFSSTYDTVLPRIPSGTTIGPDQTWGGMTRQSPRAPPFAWGCSIKHERGFASCCWFHTMAHGSSMPTLGFHEARSDRYDPVARQPGLRNRATSDDCRGRNASRASVTPASSQAPAYPLSCKRRLCCRLVGGG